MDIQGKDFRVPFQPARESELTFTQTTKHDQGDNRVNIVPGRSLFEEVRRRDDGTKSTSNDGQLIHSILNRHVAKKDTCEVAVINRKATQPSEQVANDVDGVLNEDEVKKNDLRKKLNKYSSSLTNIECLTAQDIIDLYQSEQYNSQFFRLVLSMTNFTTTMDRLEADGDRFNAFFGDDFINLLNSSTNDKLCVKNIPGEVLKKHPELYHKILYSNPAEYPNIPDKYKSEQLLAEVIEKRDCNNALFYITDEQVAKSILIKKPHLLKFFNKNSVSESLALEVMKLPYNDLNFFRLPESIRKQERWLSIAVAENPLITVYRILDNHGLEIRELLDWKLLDIANKCSINQLSSIQSAISAFLSVSTGAEQINFRINPISSYSDNPPLFHLVLSCLFKKKPELSELGRSLSEKIDAQMKHLNQTDVKPLDDQTLNALQCSVLKVYGRTVLLNRSDKNERKHLFLKFNKDDPSGHDLNQLLRECAINQVFADDMNALGLQSELPESLGVFIINRNDIPQSIMKAFDDKITVQQMVTVYAYKATEDYARFAHDPDGYGKAIDTEGNPVNKGALGIYKALYDFGRLFSIGFVYTSSLPAYHKQSRPWSAFYTLFGYPRMYPDGDGRDVSRLLPGTLKSWKDGATSRPDFRFSGMADVADYEDVGHIHSYHESISESNSAFDQQLAKANNVFNQLIASVLLFARGHQNQPDYHWKNPEKLCLVKKFIHQASKQFLAGLSGEAISVSEYLELTEDQYDLLLDCSAVEVLYWTANPDLTRHCFYHDMASTGNSVLNSILNQRFDQSLISELRCRISHNRLRDMMENLNWVGVHNTFLC